MRAPKALVIPCGCLALDIDALPLLWLQHLNNNAYYHRLHCVVPLSKTHLCLLSTGSIQEDPSDITEKLLTEKRINSNKQTVC